MRYLIRLSGPIWTILFGLTLSFANMDSISAQDSDKPHVIIILSDDLGIGDISSYYGHYSTPNIDRIAAEGKQFENYYSASPICSPSRAALLTGQAPAKLHFTTFLNTREDNRRKEQVDYLDPSIPTMAEALKAVGYTTAHFGKWHLGGGRDVTDAPNFDQYGFEEWAGTYESPDPDPAITATDWIWSDKDSIKRWDRTAYFVDKTLAFLKENADQPCFVNLWADDMHTPWVPGKGEKEINPGKPEAEKSFQEVLVEFDRQMGRLLAGLKELGIDENTILIFTSDNGPLPNFRQDRSAQLRGTKLSLYEGGIRMPFIVRWPKRIAAGSVDSVSILSALDILPTLAHLVGADLRQENLDGEDRSSVLLHGPEDRIHPLVWEYGRNNDYFSFPKGRNRSPAMALREGQWKFLMNQDGSNIELYNLSEDANENNNLISEESDRAAVFKRQLLDWWESLPAFSESVRN
ncbi:MAG: sulfatase-like hydrolase/transferase [Sphingobacterium sp.]